MEQEFSRGWCRIRIVPSRIIFDDAQFVDVSAIWLSEIIPVTYHRSICITSVVGRIDNASLQNAIDEQINDSIAPNHRNVCPRIHHERGRAENSRSVVIAVGGCDEANI